MDGRQTREDYYIQILMIGETGVGKSSVLYRYSEGEFKSGFIGTAGVDHKLKNIEYMNSKDLKY